MASDPIAVVFFAGMIAFVPENPGSNSLEALVVNVDGHDQLLVIPLNRLAMPDRDCLPTKELPKPLCVKYDPFCICELRKEVDALSTTKIIIETNPGKYTLPSTPPSDLNQMTVSDIGWLANMNHVKPSAAKVDRGTFARNVGASLMFGWKKAATCLFEEARCEKRDGSIYRKIFDIEFDEWLDPFDESHPVAELVAFHIALKTPWIKVEFWRDKKSEYQEIELKSDDGKSSPILLYNSMTSQDNSADLCDLCEEDGPLSDHFRSFGLLAGDSNGLPIHRQCGEEDYKEMPLVFPVLCEDMDVFYYKFSLPQKGKRKLSGPVTTLGDRIICPPAVLSN